MPPLEVVREGEREGEGEARALLLLLAQEVSLREAVGLEEKEALREPREEALMERETRGLRVVLPPVLLAVPTLPALLLSQLVGVGE